MCSSGVATNRDYFVEFCIPDTLRSFAFVPFICLISSQLLNYLIILAVMYLFSVLEFIVILCLDSCDISECNQINKDSDPDLQSPTLPARIYTSQFF